MFSWVLRLGAAIFIIVGLLHLTMGLGADVLLGAQLPTDVMADPVLDSQNRFYGTAFAIYGVLLLLGANDLARYSATLQCCFWCFFAAGLARLVAWALYSAPSYQVLMLLTLELALPPLLSIWLLRYQRLNSASRSG